MFLPRFASLEYVGVAGPVSWILPTFDTSPVYVWSEGPAEGTWFANPQPVKIGDGLDQRDLRAGVGRMPKRQEHLLCIDYSGVGSRENLCFCIVQLVECRTLDRETFNR